MNEQRAVLGKYYESFAQKHASAKEGLLNMDSSAVYVPTQQFNQINNRIMTPVALQNAIQTEQIQPSIQNTTAYESQLYTVNSNYY